VVTPAWKAPPATLSRQVARPWRCPPTWRDFAQVEAAAGRIEDSLGPIDVWVNVAFASVFAPFAETTPEDFRRVTEVTYLGFVHGTTAALARMRPRDHGAIVQVGSALGARSIPLQSAYCGGKHAINGFTESLRCELRHDISNVHVTVVQMPAVNTPQFSWVRSRLPRHPQPVPPIYQPEVAARGIVYAADHPGRKQYFVGATTAATILANRVAPALLDRYLARTGYDSQQTGEPESSRPDNLWEPVDEPRGATTAPTGSSTTGRTAAARNCSCPTIPRRPRPPRWSRPRPGWPSRAGPAAADAGPQPPRRNLRLSHRSMQARSSSVSTGLVT